jgi:hypothetical protein
MVDCHLQPECYDLEVLEGLLRQVYGTGVQKRDVERMLEQRFGELFEKVWSLFFAADFAKISRCFRAL